MIKNAVGVSVLLACAALIPALQASPVTSETFNIPFEFQVQHSHTILPAGEYQIQETAESPIVFLVNTKTGKRVQFIRPAPVHQGGKARLIFETVEGESADRMHVLKGIS